MIRKMNAADRNISLKILRATDMFNSAELAVATEQIDIYLNGTNQSDYSMVVAENDDFQVVGFMSYGPAPLTEGTYNLYWIAVSPTSQNRGYGKELVAWLEKHVRASSGRMILIETSSQPKYGPTREFYHDLGYKKITSIPDYYSPGDDRVTYIKSIKKMEEPK